VDINRFYHLYMIVESNRVYLQRCKDQANVAHVGGAEMKLQAALQREVVEAEKIYLSDLCEMQEEMKRR